MSTASGSSSIMGTMSSTSKSRSKETRAVMTSRLTLESWVSGPYRRVRYGGQGHQRADGERAVHRGHAAEAVDEGGGQRAVSVRATKKTRE